jgi:glycosyltransferase involved in cell wall biosynthesis
MKLLFVLPEYGADVRGGIATFYRHIFPALGRAGCDIDVCVARRGTVKAWRELPEVRVVSLETTVVERALGRFHHLAVFAELRERLATAFAAWERCEHGRDYDAVEVTDWGLLHAPWLVEADAPPVVVQLHGSSGQVGFHDPFDGSELDGMFTRLLETALLGRADELQSCGPGNAAEWGRLLKRPVHHIWPAYRCEPENRVVVPADPDTGAAGVVVSRIQSWKGPDTLCKAIALLGRGAPTILWIGSDHPYRRLDQSFSGYLRRAYPDVWGSFVQPKGEMSRDDVAAVQAAAKFVVVPSTWDTFNLTAAEAMSAGKVVICSNGAGAAQLIEHGTNGFRFPASDFAKLADLLATVDAMSHSERAEIGRRARATIAVHLDPDRIAAERVERYSQLKRKPPNVRGHHPWLDSFFAASASGFPYSFLNTIPLREIVPYVATRGLSRLWAAFK